MKLTQRRDSRCSSYKLLGSTGVLKEYDLWNEAWITWRGLSRGEQAADGSISEKGIIEPD